MDVSVVIVTYNRQKDCLEAINSVLNQKTEPLEIVVVDDASSPPFLLNHPKVRIVRNELELGLGASRNVGAKAAIGDVIAFMDDDAVASSTWVMAIHEIFGRNVDVAGGPVIPLYASSLPKWWDEEVFGRFVGISKRWIIGCNFAVRKIAFEKVGYFNEELGRKYGTLLSNEEVEFLKRIYEAGGEKEFSDKMIVYHKVYPARTTMPYLLKRSWYQGISDRLTNPLSILGAGVNCFWRIGSYLIRMVIDPKNARYYFLIVLRSAGHLFALFKYPRITRHSNV